MKARLAAVLALLVVPAAGCGTFAVDGPAPDGTAPRAEAVTCTESSTVPALDLAAALAFKVGSGTYLLATDREDRSLDSDVVVAVGAVGAMGFGWSAQRGYGKVEECRAVVGRAMERARTRAVHLDR